MTNSNDDYTVGSFEGSDSSVCPSILRPLSLPSNGTESPNWNLGDPSIGI